MPLTVIVRSAEPEAHITFDGSRVVIGRGASCDVRLPDPSVSQRHASVRIDAGVHSLVDEGSRNGTFVGGVRLAPGAPRVLKSGDLVRVGRVWLELRIDHAPPTPDLPNVTRDLALALVSSAMRAMGEDTVAKVRVVEGVSTGTELSLADEGRAYLVGRGERCDLLLDDPDASREHAQIVRRGSVVLVKDLRSKNGVQVGDAFVDPDRDVVWRPALMLRIGRSVLTLDEPVARALAELEQVPDEPLAPGDVPAPPPPSVPAARATSTATATPTATPSPTSTSTSTSTSSARAMAGARHTTTSGTRSGWSATDLAVVIIAVVVLVASLGGLVWLLRG